MRRRLLSRKWLALHALLIVCLVSFALLGRWQLTRAESVDGTIRNFAYALQWWIFAGFAVFFWWKMLRSDLAEDRREGGPAGAPGSDGVASAGSPASPPSPASPASLASSASPVALAAGRQDVGYEPGPDDEALDENDPEDAALIAYNRYLAQLNERHQRARSR